MVAEKPGGVLTVSPARPWSPSARVTSSEKGLCAPAVLPAEEAWKVGAKGRVGPGQGAPPGPESMVKYWVEVCVREARVPGREGAGHRVGAAPGRGRQQPALGAEDVHVEGGQRALRQVFEGDASCPVAGRR